jgi:ABC-type sugar transport system ATPase subunit
MYGITKEFEGIKALDDVDSLLGPGQVNCLCGENGAGKSTLIKILSGAYQCDGGEIYLNGEQVRISNPKMAKNLGIIPIYQELDLIDCLSIAENIFLGNERKKNAFVIDKERGIREAEKMMADIGCEMDVRKNLGELSVAQKQMVAIAKALSTQSKVLILDEPSDVLTGKELKILFEVIRKIKEKGVGIIYISHRLEEVFEIGDVITILRDGKFIGAAPVKDMTRKQLIQKMVGREVDEDVKPQPASRGERFCPTCRFSCVPVKFSAWRA